MECKDKILSFTFQRRENDNFKSLISNGLNRRKSVNKELGGDLFILIAQGQ